MTTSATEMRNKAASELSDATPKNNLHGTQNPIFEKLVRLESNGVKTVFEDFEIRELEDDSEWLEVEEKKEHTQAKIEEERAYLKKYASFEKLGHGLAYDLANDNVEENADISVLEDGSNDDFADISVQASVLEEDGSHADYFVHRLEVNPGDENGLVAHVLVPKNRKSENDIKVLFRGTASADGVYRDAFENGGAGTESFYTNRNLLLLQVNNLVKQFKTQMHTSDKLSLTISGHSLGGSDTQNFMAAVMDAAAQNRGLNPDPFMSPIPAHCRDGLSAVTKLRMATQNSAGVTKKTAKRAELVAGYIAEQRKKFKENRATGLNLEIECYNLRVAGDGVQQTGETHLLSDVPSDIAKVDVLKVKSAWEHKQLFSAAGTAVAAVAVGGTLGTVGAVAVGVSTVVGLAGTGCAHTSKLFEAPIEAQYERMDNGTPAGQKNVSASLNGKSAVLNHFQNAVLSTKNAIKGLFASSKPEVVTSETTQQKPNPVVTRPVVASTVVSQPAVEESRSWLPQFLRRSQKVQPITALVTDKEPTMPAAVNRALPVAAQQMQQPAVAERSSRRTGWFF